MEFFGIDFTSKPSRRKPMTCVRAELAGQELCVLSLERWTNFVSFEAAINRDGPWIAGIDFPFGQSSKFIANIGWPRNWCDYVKLVGTMTRAEFRRALDDYRAARPYRDKEHLRKTDALAGSKSPQKLYGVPVALMFYEGAPRLLASRLTVPGVIAGDPDRIVVEAYPGVLARHLIGKEKYKDDSKKKQSRAQYDARLAIVRKLQQGELLSTHGVRVLVGDSIANDPNADDLDALLCAVQAAAAWIRREAQFGCPESIDPNEGWIAEPTISC
jgi:hypothetical protein